MGSEMKAHIEGIQTVIPAKITEPRRTRVVTSLSDPGSAGIFKRFVNVILYYKEEESAWSCAVAGWVRESLGRALVEQPMISGRLVHKVEGVGGDGDGDQELLEMVSNDSSARLVEARMPLDLSHFLASESNRKEAEAQLVFWKDIDEHNPDFSPLFYVQVTNFQCGGYSIGLSSSILLLDLLLGTNFLNKWADIHNKITTAATKGPTFYLPNLKGYHSPSPASVIVPNSSNNYSQTIIFKMACDKKDLDAEHCKKLSLLCLQEAEKKVGREVATDLPLFLSESSGSVKVETCSKPSIESACPSTVKKLVYANWTDFGLEEVSFKAGNKPAAVSCWHGFDSAGVMVALPSDDGITVLITVPTGGY